MQQIEISSIRIKRDDRQRKRVSNLDGLKASLSNIGQINPIVIDKDDVLVAGERRLTAATELGWKTIGFVRREELSEIEASMIELEENIKREDLQWVDRVQAMLDIRNRMQEADSTFTTDKFAELLGQNRSTTHKMLTLANNLSVPGNEDLAEMASWRTAYNTLGRRISRGVDSELEKLGQTPVRMDATEALGAPQPPKPKDGPADDQMPDTDTHANDGDNIRPARPSDTTTIDDIMPARSSGPVLNESFLDWAPEYTGERFNFIHCDFPYGINHNKSAQGGADRWGSYDDSEDIFFDLLAELLNSTDRIAANSAHLMFWFSMKHYSRIMQAFQDELDNVPNPWIVNPMPLVWMKTDNTGVLPDAGRGPRQIYETALIATRGDRRVVQAVGNAYGTAGRDSSFVHQSQKPEPMLKHFFRMFVDGSSNVLDPTAGSGSALCVAKSFGADRLVGLEIDSEMAQVANRRIREAGAKDA